LKKYKLECKHKDTVPDILKSKLPRELEIDKCINLQNALFLMIPQHVAEWLNPDSVQSILEVVTEMVDKPCLALLGDIDIASVRIVEDDDGKDN